MMDGAPFAASAQGALRDAIMDPAAAVPPGLTDGAGRPAGRRFSVYRNNVAVSLIDALEAAFPVVAKLVGQTFFRAMAGVFVRAHPPRSPLMMLYGAELPRFLAGFAPVGHLPYLADVARLEQAIRESYHAADAEPIDASALSPQLLAGARLRLAPSLCLIRSHHPLHAIWAANTSGGPRPVARAEDVLVTRPALDPIVTRLPAGAALLERLMAGEPVGTAATEDEAIIGALFGALLSGGAITGLETAGGGRQ